MSTYYILVNKTKKEYLDASDINKNNKWNGYRFWMTRLLGYLMLSEWGQCGCRGHDGDFTFMGHWAGDEVLLVSEHREEYDIAQGLCDTHIYDEKEKRYKWVPDRRSESAQWVNISIPLKEEWNRKVMEYFNDLDEDYKDRIFLLEGEKY